MYRKRLIATAVSIFALGVVFGIMFGGSDTFSFRAVFIVLFVLSVIFLAVLARPNGITASKSMSATAFAVAAFSLGVLRVYLYNDAAEVNTVYNKLSDYAVFEISEVNSNSVDAYVISSELGVPKGELVRLHADNLPNGLINGDTISAEITYKYRNSSVYLSNGISLSASGSVLETESGEGIFYSIRNSVSESSDKLYSDFSDASAISKAVTVGDRSDLDSYIFTVYKTAGISHILAISGLHISIIAMSLYNLLVSLSVNKKVICVSSSLFAVAYAALVGFTPGAVRSAVMIVFFMMSRLFFRRSDGITAISIALFVLVFINPYSICSAGLQLSFVCSLGIMLIDPVLNKINILFSSKKAHATRLKLFIYKLLPAIITPAITSFIASVFSFPILCLSFDTVSYASPFVNIIAVPLFTYAVKLALLGFIFAPISNAVAMIFTYPAGILFDFVTDISKCLFDLDVGIISAHAPLMIIPLILSVIMIGSLIFLSYYRKKVFAVSAILFCISIMLSGILNIFSYKDTAIVEYGNSAGEYVYFSAEDHAIYVDLGGYTSNPDVVYENGLTSLESYVMLDYNSFSLARLDYFSGTVKVSKLHLPQPQNSDDIFVLEQIKQLANQRNCDIIFFNDYFVEALHPDASVEILGSMDSVSEETLICIDINGKAFRFLGNGYDNAVNCDVAIATDNYNGDFLKLIADDMFASKAFINNNLGASKYFESFEEKFGIKIDISESEYKIYEP